MCLAVWIVFRKGILDPKTPANLDILAKQCNSWLRGTKNRFGFLSNTERIQKNSEEFRGNLEEI
jgi:hypothetical protein